MDRIASERRTFRVVHASDATHNVRHLVFAPADGRPFHFHAGQWLKLSLAEGLQRDYSIASAEGCSRFGADAFELLVTRVVGGPGSEALHRAKVGDELEGLGPNGLFFREERHRESGALFVGTGTGVAPLRAMLQAELASESEVPLRLLFGCRTEADLILADEFHALASAHRRFRYDVTLSAPTSSWEGNVGYVQNHLSPSLGPETHVYICGLKRMVDDVREALKTRFGIDRRFLHSERYD